MFMGYLNMLDKGVGEYDWDWDKKILKKEAGGVVCGFVDGLVE